MRRHPTGVLFAAALVCLLAALPAPACAGTSRAAHKAAPARPGALALWTPAQLAEPRNHAQVQAERVIRQLAEPDMAAPSRTAPVEPAPRLPEELRGIIRRVNLPAGDRRVALTFDLCERTAHVTGYDARLVDALRRANARATFFVGGKWLRSHPERALQLMADPRFAIGNHTWAHANMFVADAAMRQRQLQWTNAQYELLAEELDRRLEARRMKPLKLRPLRLFRLPYGRGDVETARFINDQGLAVIQWDVVGEGGQGDARARATAIAEAVRPGSIVLLHANAVPKDTAAVVRLLLPMLARKGYATATVGELLRAGSPQVVDEGYFSTPGDNRIYDTMFLGSGTGARVAR
jgi:peptidoglycan/xylan/chitin deacetylase (PgdA/CDA1 family)